MKLKIFCRCSLFFPSWSG